VSLARLALPKDEDALYDLLMALAADNDTFGDELSESRIREHILKGTRIDGGMHGVIDGNGELAGSVGLVWDRWWYAKDFGLAQLWFFVRPAYRRRGYEGELIKWAKEMRATMAAGCDHPIPLVHTVISHKRLPAKLRLWRRQAGEMIGGIFVIR
jgi:GNAT superfamily N-acetyltransferase